MDEHSVTNTASQSRRFDDSRLSSYRHLPCKIFHRAWKKKYMQSYWEEEKKAQRCLQGGLEVPWTNGFAMKGKVDRPSASRKHGRVSSHLLENETALSRANKFLEKITKSCLQKKKCYYTKDDSFMLILNMDRQCV